MIKKTDQQARNMQLDAKHNYDLSFNSKAKQNHAKRVKGKENDERHETTKWN